MNLATWRSLVISMRAVLWYVRYNARHPWAWLTGKWGSRDDRYKELYQEYLWMKQGEGEGSCFGEMLVWERVLIKTGVTWARLRLLEGNPNSREMTQQLVGCEAPRWWDGVNQPLEKRLVAYGRGAPSCDVKEGGSWVNLWVYGRTGRQVLIVSSFSVE